VIFSIKTIKMKIETRLRMIIVILCLSLIVIMFYFFDDKRKFDEYKVTSSHQIDSITVIRDSLHDEIFQIKVENGRHELTRDYFFEQYPNLFKQYDDYYSHQTE
jgi:hypothetical protein